MEVEDLNHVSKGVVVNVWAMESHGSHEHKARREQEASRRKMEANGAGGPLGRSA